MRRIKVYQQSWSLHSPFVISRGSHTQIEVVVEVKQHGILETGECLPYLGYGESNPAVMAQITLLITALESGLSREALQQQLPAGSACNAIDCALWELEVRRRVQSLAIQLCQQGRLC